MTERNLRLIGLNRLGREKIIKFTITSASSLDEVAFVLAASGIKLRQEMSAIDFLIDNWQQQKDEEAIKFTPEELSYLEAQFFFYLRKMVRQSFS